MRIGVDASCWTNRRGYGRYTRGLLTALLAADRRNEYCWFIDSETADTTQDLPAPAHRVIVQTSRAAERSASASGRRSLRDVWAMRQAVRHHRPPLDLIFFPSVYTFFPVTGRFKVVVAIHDAIAERHPALIFPHWRARLLWTLKVRWAVRQAGLVTTVSEAAKEALIEQFGIAAGAIRVIPDAADPTFRPLGDDPRTKRILATYGIRDAERFILYVGGLSPHKNVTTLIDAYARLLRREACGDLRLVLVGDFQGDVFFSSFPALREMVHQSGLTSRVIFTGFVPDAELVHLYNAAQALVLPSFDEGFGLPVLEAMACGVPVVASRIPALLGLAGDAALYFEPRQPDELSHRLGEVLRNAQLRQALGRNGLSRAHLFSWERSAGAAVAVFEELASRRAC
jgi:glycosyltransferase involved in cell wall biosynthesis